MMLEIRDLSPVYDAVGKCWTCVAMAFVDGKLIAIKGGRGADEIEAWVEATGKAQKELNEFEFPSLRGHKSLFDYLLTRRRQ